MNRLLERIIVPNNKLETDWNTWFSTPGDTDDFIFYWDEENRQSEK